MADPKIAFVRSDSVIRESGKRRVAFDLERYRVDEERVTVARFRSLFDCFDRTCPADRDEASALISSGHGRHWSDGDGWSWGSYGRGAKSWDEARKSAADAIRAGRPSKPAMSAYKSQASEVRPAISELVAKGVSRKRKRKWNPYEGELDVERYVVRDPSVWVQARSGSTQSLVRFGVNLLQNCDSKDADFARNVAYAAAAIEILERLGYATELVGFGALCSFGSYPDSDSICMTLPLKAPDERIDIAKILSSGTAALARGAMIPHLVLEHRGTGGLGSAGVTKGVRAILGKLHLVERYSGTQWVEGVVREITGREA